MRLLLAARLSQAKEAQTGIDTQDQDAREWAEREGHEIVGVAADKISGAISPFRRKALGPWLNDPTQRAQYDGIVASKVDRYTRRQDWDMRQWAEKYGKKLIIVNPHLSWPPQEGDTATRIVWDALVDIAIAEYEATSMRYKRMTRYLREQGYVTGKRTYGFRIVTVPDGRDHKTLEVYPDEARFVRAAVDKYLAGMSLADVCVWLDAEGSLSPWSQGDGREPKPWTTPALNDLFRNESLIGRRVDDAGKTILRHEPLLRLDDGAPDLAKWNKLQATLSARSKQRGPTGKTAMLTGIVFCVHCGGPMYRLKSVTRRSGKPEYVKFYYRCNGKGAQKSTCRNMVPLDELDDAVAWHMTEGPASGKPTIKVVTILGHNHEDEIAEIERDIRELDHDDPAWLDKATVLRERRGVIKALPAVPDRTEKVKTGRTVAQYWATLTTDATRRAFLLASKTAVAVCKDRKKWEAPIATSDGEFVEPND